ncbi:MAG: NCS1 family nucleobase:cation symporter-1 [Gemmatimonadota bacterium]
MTAMEGRLSNPDLDPVPAQNRTWNMWHIASLWVGMSVCIPTYMLSASMIESGMNWWQSLLAILLGNAIVLVPLMINAHAGTRYGIPFPVYARASYGLAGAHIPSIARSVVACGWFGIQTWIGGLAINALIGFVWTGWPELGGGATFMGYGVSHYASFLIFWFINLYFVWSGTESIKWMETVAAPFLIVMGLALLAWATIRVGGVGVMLQGSEQLVQTHTEQSTGDFLLKLFLPWLTAMVGYWATLSLNIPDFTRYAAGQKDQMLGQAVGLLVTMPLFSFIGVAVTSATVLLYGEAIWNPVDLLVRLSEEQGSVLTGVLSMFVVVVATLSTNIAANVVAPANSFSNVSPRRISFRTGGLIAAGLAIVIFPWKLLDLYQTWLISYSGLLGAVGGVIMCDYVVIRRMRLDTEALYRPGSIYAYRRGINPAAVWATLAGAGVALLGALVPSVSFLFSGAWFSATLAAFAIYWFLMRGTAVSPADDLTRAAATSSAPA